MINIEISKFNLKNNLESRKFSYSEINLRMKYLNDLSLYKIDQLFLFDPYFGNNDKSIGNLIDIITNYDDMNLFKKIIIISSNQINKKVLSKYINNDKLKEIMIYMSNNKKIKFHNRHLYCIVYEKKSYTIDVNESCCIDMSYGFDNLQDSRCAYDFNVNFFTAKNYKAIEEEFKSIFNTSNLFFKNGNFV